MKECNRVMTRHGTHYVSVQGRKLVPKISQITGLSFSKPTDTRKTQVRFDPQRYATGKPKESKTGCYPHSACLQGWFHKMSHCEEHASSLSSCRRLLIFSNTYINELETAPVPCRPAQGHLSCHALGWPGPSQSRRAKNPKRRPNGARHQNAPQHHVQRFLAERIERPI